MKRILVCDDDPLLVDLLSFRLGGKGFDVDTAGDGEEALRKLERSRPDAIVLDAMMPIVDGYEVLRRLRENKETAGIPVLMLTARRQEEDIVGALEMGANDFMVKPFIPEELVARLSRLVGST
ncbi:MAG TPA: response regulator [Allosphingosinicella sp.]|nr:response regulator [Allosphingosinicella sp.]